MYISKIDITNFRLIQNLSFSFNSTLNILVGNNGSGKTSILEAISILAVGKSFRTNNLLNVINKEYCEFIVKSSVIYDVNDRVINLSIKRDSQCKKTLRLNKKNITVSESAKALPFFVFHSDYLINLVNIRQDRLKLINWGLFHVEHNFNSIWKKYNNILKNRNKLLKNKTNYNYIKAWDVEFAKVSNEIFDVKSFYFQQLKEYFYIYIKKFLPEYNIELKYYKGWGDEFSLTELLKQSFVKDLSLGYSSLGAHRADFIISINDTPIKEVLSKGQQKLVSIALCLSSLKLLKDKYNKSYAILIDDLSSELDVNNVSIVYKYLLELNMQLIITCIDITQLPKFLIQLDNSESLLEL